METEVKTDYEVLPELVYPRGTGIPDLSATLVKRDGRICMYERSDDVFEVFIIQIREETIFLSGIVTPRMEVYPGNEDFGKTAWCFRDRERATARYNKLISRQGSSKAQKGGNR